jgi:raffinose/stachyose/melibiose transport system permease protein
MTPRRLLRFSIAVAAAVVFGYPLVWIALTSAKTQAELDASPWSLPAHAFTEPDEMRGQDRAADGDPDRVPETRSALRENYGAVLGRAAFGRFYINSIVVCGSSVLVTCLAGAAAAYAFARMRFRGRELLFVLLLGGTMIPIHVTLVPLYRLTDALGIRDTVLALIGPYVGFGLPVSIFILRGFFEALPRDLEDAARIDGCGAFGAFWRVALPLSAPALATVFILNFVNMWNEFAFALTLTDTTATTLPVGIYQLSGNFGNNIPAISAGLMVGVLPGLIVYFLAQKHIVKGMTAGALSG